ncbi:RNA polymerase sigma factor [Virgibacillus ndiopensis]|uniref:RNA polymerase sigma factor n=1 Tax=Virgibacillus ndiopensis TaxID=2004408 RepID=UPI000C079CF8|nr:sigma-70 family RNA polymerase sigma factor [Virgibacillus ndiopensis]
MTNKATFDEIFEQNKRRIHYQIHKLNIKDPQGEYFQEGLCAMWNAYESYQPDKGPMSTYFNYIIRNRLIDLLRKQTREYNYSKEIILENRTLIDDGNHKRLGEAYSPISYVSDHLLNDPYLLPFIKSQLTENQWKWVYYFIIKDKSIKYIATREKTTIDAVKSWGKQVKKKFKKNKDLRAYIIEGI